jgi:isoquinoline 1-oxidoreductase beta subunit
MRKAGAAARSVLLQAAAEHWGRDAAELRTEAGAVVDPGSGRRLAYPALAEAAAGIEPPANRPLKAPDQWQLLGRALPRVVSMDIASPSVMRSVAGRIGLPAMGPDKLITEGAAQQPYSIPHYRVTGYRPESPVPLGNWRPVGTSFNGFFHECFLDELAVAGGQDALAMRLAMTRDFPFAQAMLEAVGELSNWETPLPSEDGRHRGRGQAMTHSFGSTVAQVVEVSVGIDAEQDGFRIERVSCVADVGLALDPGIVETQMQSGVLYSLSAAVMGEITFHEGRVLQSNFHDYGALRLAQCPEIRVRILESGDSPTGVGEPGTPPSKPALANAIYAAKGRRIREYPFNKHIGFA